MRNVTASEIELSMIENNIVRVEHHDCAICGYITNFFIKNNKIFFDSGCDCVRGPYYRRQASFEEAAEWINMQRNDEIKSNIAAKFGVKLDRD